MSSRHHIDDFMRGRIIGKIEERRKITDAAREFDIAHSVVSRLWKRCTLNLSRAETSSRWCGVVVRRGGCQLKCRPRHLTMVQNYVVRRQKPSCS
ncbi:uncharacterized protein TNCV_4875261 [Trichonephila clavipes]|nr:uncharacterized protein TNCV_4875261 [Trichonephila clavipes]